MSTLNTNNIKHTANTGDPNLVLDPAGDVAINGKATSVSTDNADDGVTLATKDYVDANSMRGGVGADAWARTIGSDGSIKASFNLNCTRIGVGTYNYTFATPMPSANYAISGMVGGDNDDNIAFSNETATGFTLKVFSNNSNPADLGHSVVVHATTATVRVAYPYGSTSTVDSRITAIEARLNQLEGGSF